MGSPDMFTNVPGRRHLSDVLTATVQRTPDKAALVYNGHSLTWQQVEEQTNALAKSFLALGIARGDRIGIFCPPRPEYVIAFMAAARIGAILTGFNVNYTAREMIEYGKMVESVAMLIIGDLGVAEQLQPYLEEMPYVRRGIAIGESAPPGMMSFDQLVREGTTRPDAPLTERMANLHEDDGALIVFTGGTSGLPKPALLSHKNICMNIVAQNRSVGFRESDRIIQHLPMNHVSGIVLITVGAIMAGATLYLMDRFNPVAALELIDQARITLLGQVPTMFAMEFLVPEYEQYDLSSLRVAIVAGAPSPPSLMRRIAAMAPIAIHGYGLTEAAGMVTYTAYTDGIDRLLHSAGKPPAEMELRVVDEARCPLPIGEEGEIALRGDCVMLGYYGDPQATAEQIDAEGWLYTGDLGRMDQEGYVEILGRRKEMYISGGYNVYPFEVEHYLLSHPKIAACACIGRPDPVMGEIGMVFVVPKPGSTLRGKEVREFCKAGLARYKNPRHVQVIDALPLTAMGKIDKRALARPYTHGANGTNGTNGTNNGVPCVEHVPASS
jgi:acyl-CoA synthetase (AMP-forming)/AMP-acid ligase II